jgi:2-phosphoglycerate kinase
MASEERATNYHGTRPPPRTSQHFPARLRHVRWLGGGSGAGKSTIAHHLATTYWLQLYRTDDVIADHVQRTRSTDTPLLDAFLAMEMDERWVTQSPAAMLTTFPWFAGEGFDLIVEDVQALPQAPPILVEGFRLLPRLVAPLLSHPRQAVWLVPTPAFRRAAFDKRGFTWEIPSKTSKPEQALTNLLARDELFTQAVVREAHALQLPVIETDGAVSVDAMIRRVANQLDLSTS